MLIQNDYSISLSRMFEDGKVSVALISELSHIQPERSFIAAEAASAIIATIKEVSPLDTEAWILLCRLLNSSRFYREDIRAELHIRFGRQIPEAGEARVAVLLTLLNMGCRFTPVDLIREKEIELEYPWVLNSAWERSGLSRYKPKK